MCIVYYIEQIYVYIVLIEVHIKKTYSFIYDYLGYKGQLISTVKKNQ